MYATLADRLPRWTARPGTVFLVETLILSVVMAAPILLSGSAWGMAVTGLVILVYLIWTVERGKPDRKGSKKNPERVTLLNLAFMFSVPVIGLGLFATCVAVWAILSFRDLPYPVDGLYMIPAIPGFLLLVLAPVLFLALARPRGTGTPADDFLAAVRDRGLAPFREVWLQAAALALALTCALTVAAGLMTMPLLLAAWNLGKTPPMWEVALVFPFLPLGLIATAAMLSIFRMIGSPVRSELEIMQAYAGEAGKTPAPTPRTGVFGGFAVTCCALTALYTTLYPLHLGIVLALSMVTGLEATVEAAETIEEWADVERDHGRTEAELAAILNQYGGWNPQAPEAGIPALFPELGEAMPVGNDMGAATCTMTIAAAVTAGQAAPDLTYCIRTACPSPVSWNAPDVVTLASSHASRNARWTEIYFFDLLAEGRALAPGGYCTASGELANSFQG